MRKGDGADGQRAKVTENFTTEGEGEERMLQTLFQSCYNKGMHMGVVKAIASFVSVPNSYLRTLCVFPDFPISVHMCTCAYSCRYICSCVF